MIGARILKILELMWTQSRLANCSLYKSKGLSSSFYRYISGIITNFGSHRFPGKESVTD